MEVVHNLVDLSKLLLHYVLFQVPLINRFHLFFFVLTFDVESFYDFSRAKQVHILLVFVGHFLSLYALIGLLQLLAVTFMFAVVFLHVHPLLLHLQL